uniref:Reverse transcriptase domain-containing protein n=1 Tax=Tanacetum cinerariifolium TaxID=118510 RepID=A0A6L2M1U1_TANCI|nr:hypothetical protein [Tanacetum cinerariifolium]
MSYFSEARSGLRPYQFTYPERRLTMEEMLYKFTDEGKREHEEMRAFIREFRTNNELLIKERNNSLSELRFEVHKLLRVIDNTPISKCEVKGVTTRDESTEVLGENQPQKTNEPVVQPSIEVQTPSIPFPRRLRKEKEEAQQRKFLENLMQLHFDLPFIEALAQMPKCTTVLLNKFSSKERDIRIFTIPCDIGHLHINNGLADLGASISLMPYTMYEKVVLGEPKPTRMSLECKDRSIKYPRGIIENVLLKVDKFILPIDFVILDMPEDSRVPIILGRPFLTTARAMMDVFNKNITLRVGDDEVIFDVDQSIRRPPTKDDECCGIDELANMINMETQELLENDKFYSFLLKGLEKSINQLDLKSCESLGNKSDDDSDLEKPIRHTIMLICRIQIHRKQRDLMK